MNPERPDSSPPGRGTPGSAARRLDQGDLWGEGETAASPAPPRRRARAAAPANAQPPLVSRAAPVAASTPAAPAYGDPDDDEDEYYEEEPSLLGNPYVLAAVAVAGAILLAVVVVFLFGRGDDGTATPGATGNATPTPTSTTGGGANAIGLLARSIAISTVREGPALSHLELGTLPANQDVDVVGRNEDATWFLIVFPPGTDVRGWVPETALRLPDNVADVVAVAEVTPVTRPELPDATATVPAEPEGSPTPTGEEDGPDLVVSIASDCVAGEDLVIEISNAGTEDLDKALIEVIVSNSSAVLYQRPFQADIIVGSSAELSTDVPARAPEMSVVVNLSELTDVDPSNNRASCDVVGDGGNGRGNNNDNNNSGNNGPGNNLPPPIPTPGN